MFVYLFSLLCTCFIVIRNDKTNNTSHGITYDKRNIFSNLRSLKKNSPRVWPKDSRQTPSHVFQVKIMIFYIKLATVFPDIFKSVPLNTGRGGGIHFLLEGEGEGSEMIFANKNGVTRYFRIWLCKQANLDYYLLMPTDSVLGGGGEGYIVHRTSPRRRL